MTTVDKNKTTARTNQLPPNVILDRIAQGDIYNAAKSPAEKKMIAARFGWTHQDSFTRAKIAAMFGSKSGYNPHLVCRTAWKILDLISQESKPADLRMKLADLIFYAVLQSKTMGQEPSAASVPPDVQLIDKMMPELGKYRRQIEILHAWMREERGESKDMTGAELDLLREPLPNLRRDVFGGQSEEEQAVEQATEFLREAAAPMVEEDDIEMSLPEQKAFPATQSIRADQVGDMFAVFLAQMGIENPAEMRKQISALTEDISTLHLQQEEQRAEITQSLILVLGNVRNVEEAAALLAQTSKEASESIVALIDELKK